MIINKKTGIGIHRLPQSFPSSCSFPPSAMIPWIALLHIAPSKSSLATPCFKTSVSVLSFLRSCFRLLLDCFAKESLVGARQGWRALKEEEGMNPSTPACNCNCHWMSPTQKTNSSAPPSINILGQKRNLCWMIYHISKSSNCILTSLSILLETTVSCVVFIEARMHWQRGGGTRLNEQVWDRHELFLSFSQ